MIQQTLTYLVAQGVKDVRLNSASYLFAGGRLFYLVSGVNARPAAAEPIVQAPALDINLSQLSATAEAVMRTKALSPGTVFAEATLNYTVFVDEAGRIVDVQGPPTGIFNIPEITAAIRQARVKSPGLRGNIPIPAAVRITIPVVLK
jgi:hypothetical protein